MAQAFRFSENQGIENQGIILRDLGRWPGNVLRRAGLPADLVARKRASVSAEEY